MLPLPFRFGSLVLVFALCANIAFTALDKPRQRHSNAAAFHSQALANVSALVGHRSPYVLGLASMATSLMMANVNIPSPKPMVAFHATSKWEDQLRRIIVKWAAQPPSNAILISSRPPITSASKLIKDKLNTEDAWLGSVADWSVEALHKILWEEENPVAWAILLNPKRNSDRLVGEVLQRIDSQIDGFFKAQADQPFMVLRAEEIQSFLQNQSELPTPLFRQANAEERKQCDTFHRNELVIVLVSAMIEQYRRKVDPHPNQIQQYKEDALRTARRHHFEEVASAFEFRRNGVLPSKLNPSGLPVLANFFCHIANNLRFLSDTYHWFFDLVNFGPCEQRVISDARRRNKASFESVDSLFMAIRHKNPLQKVVLGFTKMEIALRKASKKGLLVTLSRKDVEALLMELAQSDKPARARWLQRARQEFPLTDAQVQNLADGDSQAMTVDWVLKTLDLSRTEAADLFRVLLNSKSPREAAMAPLAGPESATPQSQRKTPGDLSPQFIDIFHHAQPLDFEMAGIPELQWRLLLRARGRWNDRSPSIPIASEADVDQVIADAQIKLRRLPEKREQVVPKKRGQPIRRNIEKAIQEGVLIARAEATHQQVLELFKNCSLETLSAAIWKALPHLNARQKANLARRLEKRRTSLQFVSLAQLRKLTGFPTKRDGITYYVHFLRTLYEQASRPQPDAAIPALLLPAAA